MRSEKLVLHDAFADYEDGNILKVGFPYGEQTEPKIESVQSNQISEDMLPMRGECLDFETEIFTSESQMKNQ